ncbi:MAG TPA: asparagine synthetase B, partial [Legionella sp.]|nr:asparagine synthetase B [Legionella sp.]
LDVISGTTADMRNFSYTADYKALFNHRAFLDQAEMMIQEQTGLLNSRLKALLAFDQDERFPSYILRRVDHLSMANSVEVRVPFCQPGVTAFARSLPEHCLLDNHSVKKIIYNAAKNKLPESVLTRPKQPFTLPIVAMLTKGHVLFNIVQDTLHSQSFRERNLFSHAKIVALITRQQDSPNAHVANFLWSVMVLERWLQRNKLNFN